MVLNYQTLSIELLNQEDSSRVLEGSSLEPQILGLQLIWFPSVSLLGPLA